MIRALCWIRKNELVIFAGVSLVYIFLFATLTQSLMSDEAYAQMLNLIFLMLFIVGSALLINFAVDGIKRLLDAMIFSTVSLYLQDKEEEDRAREERNRPASTEAVETTIEAKSEEDVGAVSIEKPQRKMRQRKSSVAEGSVEKPRRPRGRPRKTQVDDPKSSLN